MTARRRHLMCQGVGLQRSTKGSGYVGCYHGRARSYEECVFLPSCVVAMKAWGVPIFRAGLGHEVGLIPPGYVKLFVKRQKNDMADAEAICEPAMRPTMRLFR